MRSGHLVRLGVVVVSSFTTYAMVLTLMPLFAVRIGASIATIGLMTAALAFVPLFLAVRTGSIVDRFGARRVLLVGAGLLALSPFAAVVAPSVPALFVVVTIAGLANLLTVVAGQAYTAAAGSDRGREGDFGWYTTFVSAGQVVGPIVAGIVADLAGFRVAFASAGAVAFVAIAASLWLEEVRSQDRPAERSSTFREEFAGARTLVRQVGVPFALIVTVVVAFSQASYTAFFPVILEGAGYTAATIGLLLGVRATVSMVLRPLLPLVMRVFRTKRRALKTMLVLIVVTSSAIALDQSVATAVAVALVMGVWWGLAPPLSIVMMVEGAQDARRGFALGLRIMTNRGAQLIGPILLGSIADAASLRSGFLTLAALVGAGYLSIVRRTAPAADDPNDSDGDARSDPESDAPRDAPGASPHP